MDQEPASALPSVLLSTDGTSLGTLKNEQKEANLKKKKGILKKKRRTFKLMLRIFEKEVQFSHQVGLAILHK